MWANHRRNTNQKKKEKKRIMPPKNDTWMKIKQRVPSLQMLLSYLSNKGWLFLLACPKRHNSGCFRSAMILESIEEFWKIGFCLITQANSKSGMMHCISEKVWPFITLHKLLPSTFLAWRTPFTISLWKRTSLLHLRLWWINTRCIKSRIILLLQQLVHFYSTEKSMGNS